MPKARASKPPHDPAAPAARAPAALADLLDRRVDDLRRLAGRAVRGPDVEAVHDARVATRRLKAAVDLLRPLLPDGPRRDTAEALRGLRRRLGPLRDLDVMRQHLGEMNLPAPCAAGARWAADRLRERRAEVLEKAAKKLTPRRVASRLAAWAELEPAVRSAQNAAGTLLAQAAPEQARDFAARADRVARSMRGAAAAPAGGEGSAPAPDGAVAPPDPEPADNVHELRVAGKLLRYTLELAEPLGVDVPRSVTKQFKKLQEALGLWHDYAVLTSEILRLAVDAGLAAGRPELFTSVLHLSRATWARGEHHLDQFRHLWSNGGAALIGQVVGAFAAPEGGAPVTPVDPPNQEVPHPRPTPPPD